MSNDLFRPDALFGHMVPPCAPDWSPVSLLDVDRCAPMDMDLHVSDPCPRCGAFRMRVGDYVCWGHCGICWDNDGRPGP